MYPEYVSTAVIAREVLQDLEDGLITGDARAVARVRALAEKAVEDAEWDR